MPTPSADSSPTRSSGSARRSCHATTRRPAGWIRFHLLRSLADPNEVVTFGFFDGTLEELERSQHDADFQSRRDAIDPLVETVIANGVYEIVTTLVRDEAPSR